MTTKEFLEYEIREKRNEIAAIERTIGNQQGFVPEKTREMLSHILYTKHIELLCFEQLVRREPRSDQDGPHMIDGTDKMYMPPPVGERKETS